MKIKREWQEALTIQEFAEKHDLTMVVFRKRQAGCRDYSYGAHFDNCMIREGWTMIYKFGSGSTEAEAITNYASLISDQTLVFPLSGTEPLEITVPPLITEKEKHHET